MDALTMLAAGTMSLCGMGMLESFLHRRHLHSIPIRIHVNGTRGKSGVTRLIAAGLRAGGVRTCAKTTGTLPRMIHTDGSETPIARPSRANVIEQLQVVRQAAAEQAEALVVECMALHPALQSLCELKFVRATHGVITNARADHLDVMGPTVADVARSLAGTVPCGGRLYTAERKWLPILREAVADRRSDLISIEQDDLDGVTLQDLDGFGYIEHAENVALALRVCQDLGVDRATALRGMWSATPDPGVMSVYQATEDDQSILFVNGFAANDPESTGAIWEMILQRYGSLRRRLALINCRADRPDRSRQLADACLQWSPADHYVVMGSATELFCRRVRERGLQANRFTSLEGKSSESILNVLRQQSGSRGLLVGMGNISGPGLELVQYYERRACSLKVEDTVFAEAA